MHEIITVKQLPIIEEQLRQVRAAIEHRVTDALSLECTEDAYKQVKKEKAALAKEFAQLEKRRKEVKKAILAPYEQFEALYRECVGDVFGQADRQLKDRIAQVEEGIRGEKQKEIIRYFEEYRASKGIDFVRFEDAGIAVTMTASQSALKAQAKEFLDRVVEDLALIQVQDCPEEVLVEYKKGFQVSKAIQTVKQRQEAIAQEKKRYASAVQGQERQAEARRKAEAAIEAQKPDAQESFPPEPLSPAEKKYAASFVVTGSLEQLKAVKQFLEKEGIAYECE